MQNIRDKMLYKVKEYKENKCNTKGWIKKKNVSAEKTEDQKTLEKKSGKLSADTVQNFEETLKEHNTNISAKKVRDLETKRYYLLS